MGDDSSYQAIKQTEIDLSIALSSVIE